MISERGAIANLDSESGKLLSQKAFLVAISRHREDLSIFTDSREELENRLRRGTGEKTSAIAELEAPRPFAPCTNAE